MRHYRFISGICLFLLLTIMLYSQGGMQYVKINTENLRDKPSGDKIGTLSGGTQVEVLEKRPNWVKIQVTGWIWEPSLTSDLTLVEGFTLSASHILLKTESEARDVLKKLKSGSNFDELAKQYSTDKSSASKGGSLGAFKRGDFLPAFENAALALQIGEISGVVKTPLGYHIIRRDK